MSAIAYYVTASFPTEPLRDEFLRWLIDEHLAEVLAAGASSAHAVRLDDAPPRVIASYTFADRGAFDQYLRDHAPALRQKGLSRFPPSSGVSMTRQVGTIFHPRPNVRSPSRPT